MRKREQSSVVGIVAEYNPLHNGHKYHIEQAKSMAHADYCVVVMSGDFVQRGTPAIYDKYTRTEMALNAGADLVLELPAVFATSSAEDFASGAISLLNKLNIVDFLCFGSESGNAEDLFSIARLINEEHKHYTTTLKQLLKKGYTFPHARSSALQSCYHNDSNILQLMSLPNNILGIEYCRALLHQNSHIRPLTIQRSGSGYHETELTTCFSSASGIRKAIVCKTGLNEIKTQVPPDVLEIIQEGYPLFPNDFSSLLHGQLLHLAMEKQPFSLFSDVSEHLAHRMDHFLLNFSLMEDKVAQLKTKQYTYTRISRALLHVLLHITKEDISRYQIQGYAPYARVLGFKKTSAHLMKNIKIRGEIPLITKVADAHEHLEGSAYEMFQKDLYCSHLYQSVLQTKYNVPVKNEYTQSVIIK